jgi:hypothetical protein
MTVREAHRKRSGSMGESGLTGGCQCGAVRYRLDETPRGASICHCRMCQKALGSPYGAFAPVHRERLVFTRGAPKLFQSSAIAERGFCRDCGTPLTYRALNSSRISVTICSLDDADAVPPQSQLEAQRAVAWVKECLDKPNLSVDDWLKSKHIADVASRQHPDHD